MSTALAITLAVSAVIGIAWTILAIGLRDDSPPELEPQQVDA